MIRMHNHLFLRLSSLKLMKSATSGVEFSFNNIMYKQTDGVAMGSPLGPALANIFVGFYEEKLFSQISKPSTYFRYIADTFAIFCNKVESENFFKQLNCLHPSLKFTFKRKNCLPFLDINMEQTVTSFKTSLDSTYVGNLSVPLNKKQTLYQLWYTGH